MILSQKIDEVKTPSGRTELKICFYPKNNEWALPNTGIDEEEILEVV